MSGWPTVPLGDVVRINPRPPHGISPSMEVSFVPMAAVDEVSGTIANPQIRAFSTVAKGFPIFAEGDVLFAKITPCMENGKAALATGLCNGIGAGSTEFFVLRTGDRVLAAYVYHFLRRQPFRDACKANFTGSAGQQRVPRSFLEKAPIPLPPLEEQRRIVALLDRAEAIRRRADTARQTARALIPALFTQTFGDPATNPKGWPLINFTDAVGDITRLVPKIMKRDYLEHGRFPVFDQGQAEVAGFTDDETVTFEAASPLILFGDHTRIFRLVSGRFARGADGVRMFKPEESLTAQFLSTYLELHGLPDAGYSRHYRFLKNVPVAVPPLPLQTAFATQARRIEAMARALDAATAKAEATAAAFSARLFGQARPPA